MHVHSYISGDCKIPVFSQFCRESYTDPEELYSQLARRGMDLVTLTDHDSIEGCEPLRQHANFFVSEELTCRLPSGTEVHVGVYDITERQHVQLLQRRNDFVSLLAYLSEKRLLFSINHVFSGLTGRRQIEDFAWCRDFFPAIETRNGQILSKANILANLLVRRWDKIELGGSDAHALVSAGTAWTEVPNTTNKEDFLAGLRAGMGRAGGESGSYWKLTRDIFLIIAEMLRHEPLTVLLAPLGGLIPLATMANLWQERLFARRWERSIFDGAAGNRKSNDPIIPQPAAGDIAWP